MNTVQVRTSKLLQELQLIHSNFSVPCRKKHVGHVLNAFSLILFLSWTSVCSPIMELSDNSSVGKITKEDHHVWKV